VKPRTAVLAALAAAIIASAVAALSAQGQSGTTLTFKLATPGPGALKTIDHRPHGLSLGDEVVGAISLRASGHLAGRVQSACTITDRRFAGQQCVLTLVLRRGVITTQVAGLDKRLPGAPAAGSADVFAVTGGTGRYHGANGVARITHPQGGDVLTVQLEP
jgi:hypothetical protein